MAYRYTDEQIKFIVQTRESTDLTWQEIAELFEQKFKQKRTLHTLRNAYIRYNSFELDESTIIDNLKTAQRYKKKNRKVAKENRIILENIVDQEDFINEFKELLKTATFKTHKKANLKKIKTVKRCVVGHLSDIHIEANIDKEEMGNLNSYSRKEQARRLALFCKQLADYKRDYRKETELKLVINGDVIQGLIHGIEYSSPMTTQVSAAIHLLTQGITYLAQHYCKIEVLFTQGNHGRVVHLKDNGRVTQKKWDNYSTLVGIGIKYFIKSYKNIKITMPTTPYIYTKIMKHDFFITHGDGVINPGNIGKNISTEKINSQINSLMSGIGNIDAVLLGHVHVPAFTILNNGVLLAVNGCVSGIDPFCQTIGLFKNSAVQQIFEVTDKHCIGDMRFVNLLEADNDKNLDKIIEPFSGKF